MADDEILCYKCLKETNTSPDWAPVSWQGLCPRCVWKLDLSLEERLLFLSHQSKEVDVRIVEIDDDEEETITFRTSDPGAQVQEMVFHMDSKDVEMTIRQCLN